MGTNRFELADYADGTSSGNFYWRGYEFQIEENIRVTGLIGGATSSQFKIGLYKSDGSRMATELLTWGDSPSTRRSLVEVEPVILEKDEYYIIAQGRDGSSGSHYHVNTFSANEVVNEDPIISYFDPDDNSIRWSSGGSQSYIVNRNYRDTSTRPDIGFEYEFERRVDGKINIDGEMREINEVYVSKDNGYKTASNIWVSVDGAWKLSK